MAWAAIPPNNARAVSSRNRACARPRAERSAGSPNRASASGCLGRCTTGCRISGPSFATSFTSGPKRRRQARPSALPRPAPVAPTDRSSRAERPPSSGCAIGASGWTTSTPAGSEIDRRKEGRGDRQGQDGRTDIVPEPGQRQLGGPHPAAGDRGRLIDADRAPGPGQGDRRGQAVGPGTDDDRVETLGSNRRQGCRRLTPVA